MSLPLWRSTDTIETQINNEGLAVELIYPPRPLSWDDVIYDIQEILKGHPDVYLVGGMVRDAYRGYPFKDIDLACAGDGCAVARKIADEFGGMFYPLDKKRGVGRAILQTAGQTLRVDVATLRGDLITDLSTRDFTINAMCIPLDSDLGGIYDPLGGMQDWLDKTLRRCGPSSIQDDPVRGLRGVRQSITLGLTIEPETRADIRAAAPLLVNASMERIRDEFCALLDTQKPAAGLVVLKTLGLLPHIIPEIDSQDPQRWMHSLKVVDQLNILLTVISPRRDDNIAANAAFGTYVYLLDRYRAWLQGHLAHEWPENRTQRSLLILAALLRYQGEDDRTSANMAEERAFALKLSRDEVIQLGEMIALASIPWNLHAENALDGRQIYRYWRGAGQAGIDACLLALVEYLAVRGVELDTPQWTAFLQDIGRLFAGYHNAMEQPILLTGNSLMEAFNLRPGKHIGRLLESLRESQALGEVSTTDDAYQFAQAWLQHHGFGE